MHFYKSAVALSTLFATLVLASPTPRTTCTGKVWGVSDPSVTWEYVGIERNTTEINEILFDTSYALSASCPTSGLDTATWWVEVSDLVRKLEMAADVLQGREHMRRCQPSDHPDLNHC
jgi:hypothetical protein